MRGRGPSISATGAWWPSRTPTRRSGPRLSRCTARRSRSSSAWQDAERRHASRLARATTEADRRCAGVLHRLVQDGLDDSRTYDALTGLSRGAGAVGGVAGTLALVPVLKALGVVAGAGDGLRSLADTAVRVGYGDGDWGSIALTAGASATGPLAAVLKRGALATNPAALATDTRDGRRLLRLDTRQRLGLGAVA